MSLGTRARRWSARGSVAALVLLAGAGTQAAAVAAQAGAASAAVAASSPPVNPYAPAHQHPYRRGAVPTLGDAARMAAWAAQHPGGAVASPAHAATSRQAQAASANNVSYGGGTGGIGVTTGDEKVYLVFYGSQWGTSTVTNGIMTFSHDPSGEARYVQELFRGLGTGGEQWSGVMTQYCEGIAQNRQTCPAAAPHVAYPHGGALAGVWYDGGAASPASATGDQLGQAAIAAAAHFGNTTAASNREASYVILSPTGTDPDTYKQSGFCAWHDYTGDSVLLPSGALSPPYIAFTNMPYVTDVGTNCGEHIVRSGKPGVLDGVSIVVGHEYAETITDQEPTGGWFNASLQEENADLCAWRTAGLGKIALLGLPTGTFAMQGTWANNANSGKGGCRFTQTVKTTQLLQNPGFETGTLSPWAATAGVLRKNSSSFPAHSGSWVARLGGRAAPHTDTLAQTVQVAPAGGRYGAATVSFWLEVKTTVTGTKARDTLKVQELTTGGTVIKTLATFSNLNHGGYARHTFSLSPASYQGQPGHTVVIKFTGTETVAGKTTSFLIDDTALNAS